MLNTRHLSEKSKEIELQKDPQRKTLNLISDCLKTHNGVYADLKIDKRPPSDIIQNKVFYYYFILNSIVTLNRSPSRYSLNSPP